MSGFKCIKKDDIDFSLEGVTRQYLTGNLKNKQKLDHIHDEKVEIGITSYDTFKTELPHMHSEATEYQYVISGFTVYLDLDTNMEYEFSEGDFYVILPGTKYAQKSKPGTKILFIKIPSINDKIAVEADQKVQSWFDVPFNI